MGCAPRTWGTNLLERVPALKWVEQRITKGTYDGHTFLRWYRGRSLPALVRWNHFREAWVDDWDQGCEVLEEMFAEVSSNTACPQTQMIAVTQW